MAGITEFQYLYQISPIILVGGVASQIPGGQVSIYSYLQGGTDVPITGPGLTTSLDDFFAQFVPLQGAELINQDIGEYPFYNQQTAANAVITKPLTISFKMICPARGIGGFSQKQAILSALQATLAQHNLSGGLYTCVTPAFIWDNCVMRAMRDVTPESESSQRQVTWELDFEQPLVTQQAAAAAANTFMHKIQSGVMLTPDGTGTLSTSGPQAASASNAPSVTPPATGGVVQNFTGGFNDANTPSGSFSA